MERRSGRAPATAKLGFPASVAAPEPSGYCAGDVGNVEIVKANIDAVNREDWDAAFQDAGPGFELDMSRAFGLQRGIFGLDQAA